MYQYIDVYGGGIGFFDLDSGSKAGMTLDANEKD